MSNRCNKRMQNHDIMESIKQKKKILRVFQIVMNSKGCIEKSDVYRFFNRGVGLFAAPGAKIL